MTIELSANFVSRDAADLALMRLRQGGLAFSVMDIRPVSGRTSPEAGSSARALGHANNLLALNQQSITLDLPQYLAENSISGHRGGEIMILKIRSEYLSKAKELLTGCGGKDIRLLA
jgi:hypothetical protein